MNRREVRAIAFLILLLVFLGLVIQLYFFIFAFGEEDLIPFFFLSILIQAPVAAAARVPGAPRSRRVC